MERCGADVEPYGRPYEEIQRIEWVSDTSLRIEGYVRAPCGGVRIRGAFDIDGDDLILEYKVRTGRAVTECGCAHAVVYEFTNLELREYAISISRAEQNNK